MKANYYKLISDCVENGIAVGYRRAFKHTSEPEEFVVKERINDAIMELINENFIFDNIIEGCE
jgi:hypothetical protein